MKALKLFLLLIPVALFSCSQATTKIEFSTFTSDWYYLGTFGSSDYRNAYDYQTNLVTANIYSEGTVLGYLKANGANEWLALPYDYCPGSYVENLSYSYSEGHIYLISKRSDNGTASTWSGPFKFLIVPPQKMNELDGIDLKNYYEVEAALK